MEEQENKVITFEYKGATAGRTFAVHLFDFFCVIVLGAILLVGGLFAMNSLPFFKDAVQRQNETRLASKLYVPAEDDNVIMLSKKLDQNQNLTSNEKSQALSTALEYYFYVFLKDNSSLKESEKVYEQLLLEYKTNDGQQMFDEKRNRLVVQSVYDLEYFTAYYQISNAHAIGYLAYVPNYIENRRVQIWSYVITILLSLSLSALLLLYVVPLFFSRGRRTFGMILNHVGYISLNGFSPTLLRFTLHFLFQLFFVILASCFAFLIPLFISVTMLFLSKKHQGLTDYVIGCFMVRNDEDYIFKDYLDYERVMRLREEASKNPLSQHLHLK